MRKFLYAGSTIFALLAGFYLFFFHYTDLNHATIVRNLSTGKLRCDVANGAHVTPFWYQAVRIDTRPVRVCITTTARTMNCKLVQFEPGAYEKFIQTQGFKYYWWANRLSFNSGYGEEYRGVQDILRGYAFSVEKFPFLKVLREFDP